MSKDESPRLNDNLQTELEAAFKPLGIVAYSNCCRLGCTGTYEEDDPDFKITDKDGIYFIKIYLSGMNYIHNPQSAHACYYKFDYLMSNWEAEESKLDHWASILGLSKDEYFIKKPQNQQEAIHIEFHKPLALEIPKADSDGEYES
jgi:hypothetical protein